jgi:arabinogalactan endo-1,4-beta-galactosidase
MKTHTKKFYFPNFEKIICLFLLLTGFFSKTHSQDFAKGADVSWVTQMEAAGKKFYTAEGVETECMTLLKSLGMNTIRLRVWVNPADGWCNAQDVLLKAQRANDLGMRIMIDFHYSDSWADPGKQTKPAAWSNLSFADLKTALSQYTNEVLTLLKNNDITPEWVQVGNETSDGMLWEDGRISKNPQNYAELNNAGYDAVKSVFPNAKVIVHLPNGYSNSLYRWFFDTLKNYGGKWDVIGMSVYPFWYTTKNDWRNCNISCFNNMNDMVSRYGTEVMIVECGMQWDAPEACRDFLSDLINKTKNVSQGKGLGVLYWEPQCYPGWNGYTLGAFDNTGKPTIALDAFKEVSQSTHPLQLKTGWRYDDLQKVILFDKTFSKVTLFDSAGTAIQSFASTNRISMKNMQKGIYILHASLKNAEPLLIKFIYN